jgi:hypothetical protein
MPILISPPPPQMKLTSASLVTAKGFPNESPAGHSFKTDARFGRSSGEILFPSQNTRIKATSATAFTSVSMTTTNVPHPGIPSLFGGLTCQ